jgi:hypothetical protein
VKLWPVVPDWVTRHGSTVVVPAQRYRPAAGAGLRRRRRDRQPCAAKTADAVITRRRDSLLSAGLARPRSLAMA